MPLLSNITESSRNYYVDADIQKQRTRWYVKYTVTYAVYRFNISVKQPIRILNFIVLIIYYVNWDFKIKSLVYDAGLY